jgi:glutamate dehydrogenase
MENACINPLVNINPSDIKITPKIESELKKHSIYTHIDIKKDTKILVTYSLNHFTLSKVVPILDALGLEVIDNMFYSIPCCDKEVYVNYFSIDVDTNLLKKSKSSITEIINLTLSTDKIRDPKLLIFTLLENFDYKDIFLSMALINYQWQLTEFSRESLIQTFIKHHKTFSDLISYFKIKFEPNIDNRKEKIAQIEDTIEQDIKDIQNINDDKIFKITFIIIKNILRTNYYLNRDTISFKVALESIHPFLRGVQPKIETFVYNQYISGVHLRMGRVSRGGLRWSDRYEDFRVEIKSLMTTQESKNSIIVPHGAKGGFVIKKSNVSKDEFKEYYSMFINALLDLVDKDDKLTTDKNMVCYDKLDRYFVVAADKGTSAMSDVANAIAIKRDFWLQDAFASGGSNGYNHKDLGITAKGAIKSVQRFFIERGVDFYKEPISVVGIGSMSGDVFGNGILESKYFRLIGAISSTEIFIDPNPDIEIAYEERKRLFGAKSARWSDYDSTKISTGGGVYSRDTAEIHLSEQIRELINTTKAVLSGEELAKALLKLNVDLLFNGGVGTYFKASYENSSDINDKQNEFMRINATDIKAYAVAEGGNLGFSQNARIEYARNGGRINMDSIDNSAGVDTSDHEVNIKITLSQLEKKNLIKDDDRVEIFKSLTDDVVNQVLWTNYFQAIAISMDEIRSAKNIELFLKVLDVFESGCINFKRKLYSIPTNEEFHTVLTKDKKIVRPVLATMLSFAKLFMTKVLVNSKLIDEPYFNKYINKYFAKSFSSVYARELEAHPLRREIISMVVANKIINHHGVTFISDYNELGNDKFILKIKSYLIINELFSANDIRFSIYRLDYELDVRAQYKMLMEIEENIKHNIAWTLKHLKEKQIESQFILEYKDILFEYFDDTLKCKDRNNLTCNSKKINEYFGHIDYLRFAMITIYIKENSSHSYKDVTGVFYYLIKKLAIVKILNRLEALEAHNRWEKELKVQLRQRLEKIVVRFTNRLLDFKRKDESAENVFSNYIEEKNINIEYTISLLEELSSNDNLAFMNLGVIINSLDLAIE